jgi:hypothetical protein
MNDRNYAIVIMFFKSEASIAKFKSNYQLWDLYYGEIANWRPGP